MTITFFMNTNIDRTVILNLKTMENIGDLGLLQKYYNILFAVPPKFCLSIFFQFLLRLTAITRRETKNNAFGGTTKSIIMVFWKRPIHSRRSEIHNNMRKLIVTSLLNCWTINIPVCPMNYLPNFKSLPQNINWMTVWKFWTSGGTNTNDSCSNS